MADRVRHIGKQVKFDGVHLCDAATEEAAEIIAIALNHAGAPIFDAEKHNKMARFFA